MDPKYFGYQFLATSDKRGQGIPNDGDKRGGKRVTNVTRIITKLKDDSTVQYMGLGRGKNKDIKDFNSANVYHV